MSTKYIASNWRLPNQENSSKSDNYGLTFDGAELISQSISKLNSTTAFSISFWGKLSSVTSFMVLGDLVTPNTHGVSFNYHSYHLGGTIFFRCQNGSASPYLSASLSPDTDWHHFVVTYDAGTRFIYIDGAQAATDTSGPASMPATLGDTFKIGQDNSGGSNVTNGSISEVAVFDYALSSTQISTLYGSSSLGAGNPMALKPQPVAYYPLGDNSASNPLTQPNEAVADASVFEFVPNDYIDCGNNSSLNINGDLTISAWVNIDAHKNYNGVVSKISGTDRNFEILFRSTGKVSFYTQASGGTIELTTSTTITPVNTWTNLIITVNSGVTNGTKFYFNGVQDATTGTHTVTSNTANLNIGRRTTGGFEMDGKMSNIAIWNSDQSSEISNIYNSGVPATTYTNTPTAWYKLDQSANWDVSSSGNWTIPDASGNGNDGTSSGMTSANLVLSDLTRAVPYDSYSFNFDAGSNDSITLTEINLGSQQTLSFWINRVANGVAGVLLGGSNGWGSTGIAIYVETNNNMYLQVNGIIASAGNFGNVFGTRPAGNWYHICLSRDGDSTTLYVDGVSVSTKTGFGTGDLKIDRIASGATAYHFDGKMSNISLFDEALTSTEVMKLYANGVPQDLSSFSPQPVAWYTLGSNSFWNGSAWTVRDMIGSNDGTGQNIGIDGLVGNAPRSEANGTGTNMDVPTNLEGNTKWSSNNSWSINMSETARVEDTP